MKWLPGTSAWAIARDARTITEEDLEVATAPPSQAVVPFRRARMFGGARPNRLSTQWSSTPVPIDDVVRRDQRALVARSRERGATSDYGRRFLQLLDENVVGDVGVQLQAQVRRGEGLDEDANTAIEVAWREWCRKANCDVRGRLSWRAIQESCIRTAATDGEFMLRIVVNDDASPWGFAVQPIDPQRCPVDRDVDGLPDGRFVRHGIEFSRWGRPVAFHFSTLDPSEATSWYGSGRGGIVRVPASEIVHGFLEESTGQKRGLPWLAASVDRMRQLGEFELAAVVNARVAASRVGFIEWAEGFGPESPEDAELGDVEVELEPGVYRELPEGARVKDSAGAFPAGEYVAFAQGQIRAIASGLGISYHTLANNLESVSYSSARSAELTDRTHWKKLQAWLIEQLVEPVYRRWLQHALLSGRIVIRGRTQSAARFDELVAAEWQARRWQWVDPRADADAAIKAKNNGFASPSQIIREQGRDPQTVWREVARDIEAMEAAGIPREIVQGMMDPGRKNVASGDTGGSDGA